MESWIVLHYVVYDIYNPYPLKGYKKGKSSPDLLYGSVVDNSVLQLSWLERYTDNVEVDSSTLSGTTKKQCIIDNAQFIMKTINYEL